MSMATKKDIGNLEMVECFRILSNMYMESIKELEYSKPFEGESGGSRRYTLTVQ